MIEQDAIPLLGEHFESVLSGYRHESVNSSVHALTYRFTKVTTFWWRSVAYMHRKNSTHFPSNTNMRKKHPVSFKDLLETMMGKMSYGQLKYSYS